MGLISEITGGIFDILGGEDPRTLATSDAFQQLEPVGEAFSQLLLNRLQTRPEDTRAFGMLSESLREQLSRTAGAQRQRLGDTAQARGFLDSGAVFEGLADIDRAELEAFASGIRDILLGLEDRRTQNVLPFLSAAANESLGVGKANLQSELTQRGQNLDFLSGIIPWST